MKTLTIISTAAVLALASCAKKNRHTETLVPVPIDQGQASFGSKAGFGNQAKGVWRSRGTSNVLEPEQVEAYPVARYQDPANPNIMHERHFVYRKQAQRWNLTPNTSEQINLGNVPERSRIIDGRLAEKVSDMAVRDAVITQAEALKKQQAALAASANNAASIDQLELNQRKLAEAAAALDRRQKSTEVQRRAASERARAKEAEAKPDSRESGDKNFYKNE